MNRQEMLLRLKNGEDPLELSILKWQDIVDGTGKNLHDLNCALCQTHKDRYCRGCVVKQRTGESWCEATPYYQYWHANTKKTRHEAAEKEVEFLKSLRKETAK